MYSFSTKEYKLHFFETSSGLRFVLTTDKSVGRLTDTLRQLYRIYVDDCIKSPVCVSHSPVDHPMFAARIDAAVKMLPFFSSPVPE